MTPTTLPPVLVAGLMVAALAACGGRTTVEPDGVLTTPITAPNLTGPLIGGGTLSLVSLRGKVVVVNFWASWCSPCRSETPQLAADATSDASKGVEVLGVDFEDSTSNAEAFRRAHGVSYPSLSDPQGADLAKFHGVNPTGLPVTLLINRAGQVAARFEGAINGASAPAFNSALATLEAQPA